MFKKGPPGPLRGLNRAPQLIANLKIDMKTVIRIQETQSAKYKLLIDKTGSL